MSESPTKPLDEVGAEGQEISGEDLVISAEELDLFVAVPQVRSYGLNAGCSCSGGSGNTYGCAGAPDRSQAL
jgi:hypothetical protein